MFEFKLPDLGEGIHEGELLKWHAQVGETIKEDAPLVDVETDKAAVTIPSPRAGKIVSLAGNVGDTVAVGQVIVVIDDAASGAIAASTAASPTPSAAATPAVASATVRAAAPVASTPAPPASAIRRSGPVAAAPATRRVAREMGIDIHTVAGTGPGGRISLYDLKNFAAGGGAARTRSAASDAAGDAPSTPAAFGNVSGIPYLELEAMPDFASFGPVEREPVRSIRKKVAKRMVTSMVLVPHVAHMDEADVTQLDEFRARMRKELAGKPGGKISLMPFVMKAVVEALKNYPMFNASLDPYREELVYKKYYNLGVAVDSGKGLIVPVIKGCDEKSVLEVSADVEAVAAKARAGSIEVNDLRGGTFTITNVGSLGGTGLFPTINYPEVAILGMAKAAQRAVVRDGQIVVRTIMPLTLAFDHRVADGADAARFMNEIIRRLSDPLYWLMTR